MTDNNENIAEANRLLRSLIEKSDKLTSEVSRLHGDVRAVQSAFFTPDTIDGQQEISIKSQKIDAHFSSKRDYSLQETLESIVSARRSIKDIEADVRAVRSKLDQILNSSYQRNELKRLMIDPDDPMNN